MFATAKGRAPRMAQPGGIFEQIIPGMVGPVPGMVGSDPHGDSLVASQGPSPRPIPAPQAPIPAQGAGLPKGFPTGGQRAPAAAAGGMFAGGRPRMDMATFGALLMAATGNPAGALFLQHRNQQNEQGRLAQQFAQQHARLSAQNDWQRQYQQRPQLRTVNGQVVAVPWDGGQPSILHQAPEDFEIYADSLGLEPGTPEYISAMQDYVLRSSGPTAHEFDVELEDHRQENRIGLEGVRHTNRSSLERFRQDRTDNRFNHGQDRQDRRTNNTQDRIDRRHVTPGAGRGGSGRGAGRGRGGGGGAVMVNPQTGQRIRWNGSAWVPA